MSEQFQGDKKVGVSLLHAPEEVLKKWLLPMVPKGVETYHLTLTTIIWSLLLMFFAFLACSDIRWMWGASLMITFQYITDLLDGAIGRKRDTGLIKWGYYMDHFLDYIFLCAILIGYSLLVQDQHKYILFFILALFGAFMVNSFLSFAATNEFQIAYLGIGPTEIRIVFILVNTILIFLSGNMYAEKALPYVLWFSTFGLFVAVYRTQEHIWDIDMKNKYGDDAVLKAKTKEHSFMDHEWSLYLSKRKITRNLGLSFLIAFIALAILMTRLFAPYHRLIAGVIYAASWGPFLLSFKDRIALLRKRRKQLKGIIRPHLPYIGVAILLIISAYVAHVLVPVQDTKLIRMTEKDLSEELKSDFDKIIILNNNMDSLMQWSDDMRILSIPVAELTAKDKVRIKDLWIQFADLSLELDILKSKYKGFYQIDRMAKRELHADAFFVQFAAFVTQYRSSWVLAGKVEKNEFLGTFLNEAIPEHTIPANTYTKIRQRLTNQQVMIRLNAWACYFPLVKKDLKHHKALVDNIEKRTEGIYLAIAKQPSLLVNNPRDFFETKAFGAWFPFQQEIATHIGRVRSLTHEYRITQNHIQQYRSKLQPGDVILERRNWKMSNTGIPGFWPHVALHTGTAEEFDAFFKDLPMLNGQAPMEYVKKQYPLAYRSMMSVDKNGHEHAIIEALEPGIIFTSCEFSLHADYIGVIRPRLSKEELFTGLLNAFSHFGKPYDFNFDFATDASLVCSELIYKAFGDMPGMTLTPALLNGRLLIKPNYFAKKFDLEFETDKQEFDFVMFIDSSEKVKDVFAGDAESFKKTWQRPKWDILMD